MPALSPEQLRALGIELFTGKIGGAWATRAERIRSLMTTLLGPEGPGPAAPALPEPEEPEGKRFPKVRSSAVHRAGAEEAAQAVVDALVNRSWEELAGRMHDIAWTLWPDGTLAKHETSTLLAAFGARAGRAAKAIPEHARSYAAAELRNIVARGIPEAIDALFDVPEAIAVTMHVDTPKGSLGSVTVFVSPDRRGKWRAHNLPLSGIDAAHRASATPSKDEDEAVRVADRIVRHVVYGHDKHVRSLRNHMMDRVMIGDAIEPAEKLFDLAGAGPHRIDRSETVFVGTERAAADALTAKLGRVRADAIGRRAKEAWGYALAKLKTKTVAAKLATLDAATLEARDAGVALMMMIAKRDRPEDEERWRLAAIYL